MRAYTNSESCGASDRDRGRNTNKLVSNPPRRRIKAFSHWLCPSACYNTPDKEAMRRSTNLRTRPGQHVTIGSSSETSTAFSAWRRQLHRTVVPRGDPHLRIPVFQPNRLQTDVSRHGVWCSGRRLIYTWMAFRLAKRTGNRTVTAMPLGLDTPSTIGLRFDRAGSGIHRAQSARHGAPDAAMMTWYIGMARWSSSAL